MLLAILSLGVSGLLFGGLLAFASKVFAVPVDPRVEQIMDALPRAQCGACGYPGCSGLAEAIVRGEAACEACIIGGPTVSANIAKIMGQEAGAAAERKVAVVHCGGGSDKVVVRYRYDGINECRAAVIPQVAGKLGHTQCSYGCLGFGTCVAVCPFDAIWMGSDGLPVVDRERCTGCGKCVTACPRAIIDLQPASVSVHVLCRNKDRGAAVRRYCRVGCIACRACARAVPGGYVIADNLAAVDYTKAIGLDLTPAIAKCPTKTIVDLAAPQAEVAVATAAGGRSASA
jgi:electron transport complex protein RnfB